MHKKERGHEMEWQRGEERVITLEREWNKLMWKHCKFSILKLCSALNWHERSTMAATTTREKEITVEYVSRLRRTSAYDYMWWHKWIEKRLNYVHTNSFTSTHIPNYFVTKMKHANFESFEMISFAHILLFFRWNGGKEFL